MRICNPDEIRESGFFSILFIELLPEGGPLLLSRIPLILRALKHRQNSIAGFSYTRRGGQNSPELPVFLCLHKGQEKVRLHITVGNGDALFRAKDRSPSLIDQYVAWKSP